LRRVRGAMFNFGLSTLVTVSLLGKRGGIAK
jgi:hypothetical protein